ncbi:MAG: hypothetical protein SFU86_13605 [Pirellulaceae bacterium]|nr:hypothetical protein [Pirellulaceae bacterium]
MSRFRIVTAALACVLGWVAVAAANPIAVPRPPQPLETKSLEAPLVIKRGALEGRDRAIEARVLIPRSLLPVAAEKGAKQAAAPPIETQSGGPPLGTLIAAVCLSLAAVSLLFVVRGSRSARVAGAAVLLLAMGLCAWSTTWANVPPPRPEPNLPPPSVAPLPSIRLERQPKIVIEFTDEGGEVVLELR